MAGGIWEGIVAVRVHRLLSVEPNAWIATCQGTGGPAHRTPSFILLTSTSTQSAAGT